MLPANEREDVMRFRREEDRKRAIVSRLLQRHVINSVLNVPYADISIARTLQGKPYLANSVTDARFPNFNFNATHHGDYVALASEPLCLVGVDVMAHEARHAQMPAEEFFQSFTGCYTPKEWAVVRSAGPCPDAISRHPVSSTTGQTSMTAGGVAGSGESMDGAINRHPEGMARKGSACGAVGVTDGRDGVLYDQFYRHWCLKEAYIKAVGIGLGFELGRAEFACLEGDPWAREARVAIDGAHRPDWRFFLDRLGANHWVCVARGPPSEAVHSYRAVLPQTIFPADLYQAALLLPSPAFSVLQVQDLIPGHLKAGYLRAGGDEF
eukprot:jgi/Mesvir1/27542/Mv07300-RA.1